MNISMRFDITAGRYEDQCEKNYKYCDSADTVEEALTKWRSCEDYDFAEMELVVECDGAVSRIGVFGGQDKEAMLRMSIASAWMKVMDTSFVDLLMDADVQLEEIVHVALSRKEQLERSRPFLLSWLTVHAQFSNGLLTWTEAFDALMSQCGMPMEEALSCLAENFDRRPAVNVKEV